MAISLINNSSSLDSQSRLAVNASKLNNTIQRLSSGLRINSSGDDAAGLAVANVFRSDISQLRQGVRNANDGVSTLQIIDGGLNTVSGLLDRAVVLASQSASDTFSGNRGTLQAELDKVMTEVTRQAQNIGLGSTDAANPANARFNKAISVFIGGGTSAQASNNEVKVDLSGSSVDAKGLKLDTAVIADRASGSAAYVAPGAGGAALTFSVNGGTAINHTIAAGATLDAAVTALNADTAFTGLGLKAIAVDGKLAVDSANGSVTVGGAGAGTTTIVAGTSNATASAKAALTAIKTAIGTLGSVQGKVGAGQNNLAQAIDLATTQITNFQAAESRIRDADVASEASDLARLTTLQQAGVAALAQANQSSQAVLSLLR